MQEEIKQLKQLIVESQNLLKRLRKILNIMVVVASITFIPFLYSFVAIQVRLSTVESQVEPRDFYYNTFVQKIDALAVHTFEDSWINTQLYKITNDPEYKESSSRKILIEGFFNETHRGN